MQSLVVCRVANLALLKPNFEILAFLKHLAFFENQEKPVKIWLFLFYIFFSLKGLALVKNILCCIFITNLFLQESMIMQGAKNLLLFKKCSICNSIFMGQKNASTLEFHYIDVSDEF